MAANSALRLCSRLFLLLALGHSAVIKPEVIKDERIGLLPDEACPCLLRSECPRVFGSQPEDESLGNFSPCEDLGAVRCCGISTRVSVGHSVSTNNPGSRIVDEDEDGSVTHPEIVTPTSSVSPEYVDPKKIGEEEGEKYSDEVSQENNAENEGDVQINKASGLQRGTISSDERVETESSSSSSTSSSSSSSTNEKVQGIDSVAQVLETPAEFRGEEERGVAANPEDEIDHEDLGSFEEDYSLESSEHGPSEGIRKSSTVFKNREELSSRKQSEKVIEESSNFGESSSLVNPQRGVYRFRPSTLNQEFETAGYGIRGRVSNQQRTESVAKESKNVEESSSSNSGSSFSTTEEKENLNAVAVAVRRRRPVSTFENVTPNTSAYGQRKEASTLSRQEMSSVNKESSTIEENTSSNIRNSESLSEGDSNSEALRPVLRRRRPISNRGNIVYGQERQTSYQQRNTSASRESPNIEKSSISSTRNVAAKTENLLENNDESEVLQTTPRPVFLIRRRPTATRSNISYGEQRSTSSRQRSSTVKNKASEVEENTSTKVQTIATDNGDSLKYYSKSKILPTTPPALVASRRPTSSRGQTVFGGQKPTSNNYENQSANEESPIVEKSGQSEVQNVATNTVSVSKDNSGSEMTVTTWRPATNRGNIAYGQEVATTLQRQSNSVTKESSNVETSSSPSDKNILTNTENLSDYSNSEVLPAIRRPSEKRRRPVLNTGNIAYGQEGRSSSSRQESSSVMEESSSSSVQGSSSSSVRDVTTNGGNVLNDKNYRDVIATVQRPSIRGSWSTTNRDSLAYGIQKETVSKQSSSSVNEESSNVGSSVSSTSGIRNVGEKVVELSRDETPSNLKDNLSASRKESSSSSENKESSESSFPNVKTEGLSHEDADSRYVRGSDESTSLHRGETTSTETKSEKKTEELSGGVTEDSNSSDINQFSVAGGTSSAIEEADRNRSPIIVKEVIPESMVNSVFEEDAESSSTSKKSRTVSRESSSSKKEETAWTSNLWNMFNRNESPESEVNRKLTKTENMNRKDVPNVWQVRNRTYVPVLINAGLLRDRPIATGEVGLDPLSGVTYTDVFDSNFAPELLPLTCGNVVFGERSEDGKTLVCVIPKDDVQPLQFSGRDMTRISPGKLNGLLLSDSTVYMPPKASITRNTLQHRFGNTIKMDSEASSTRGEDLPRKTTLEDDLQEAPRRILASSTPNVDRDRIRHAIPVGQSILEGSNAAIGSKKFSQDSVTTSSSSSQEARSFEESMSSSNSNEQITKSGFEATSSDQYDAQRNAALRNSELYIPPAASILPIPETDSTKLINDGESKIVEIVEEVEEAPTTRDQLSEKILSNFYSGKKLPAKSLLDKEENIEDAEILIPAEGQTGPQFFHNRNSRHVGEILSGVKEANIYSEDFPIPGRVNVVGPIPAGYQDPAIFPEEQLDIDLPADTTPNGFKSANNFGKHIDSAYVAQDYFKAPLIAPINWQW